jgi:hypothetical protein
MFKKKFLGVLLGILAVVIVPSFAYAQLDEAEALLEDVTQQLEEMESTYEDSYTTTSDDYDDTYDWDWDYESEYDYDYDYDDVLTATGALAGIAGIFSIVGLVVMLPLGLVMYVYTSLTGMKTAQRLGVENAWFAWIPILSTVLRFQVAGMSGWLVLAMIVPVVNIVLMIIALMKTCEKRGYDKLLGLLGLVPVANLVLMGILAWGKDKEPVAPVQANVM